MKMIENVWECLKIYENDENVWKCTKMIETVWKGMKMSEHENSGWTLWVGWSVGWLVEIRRNKQT